MKQDRLVIFDTTLRDGEQAPGFGECAVARGAVEQAIPELFLEPLDGLAHRRLGAVELLGGLGKAPFGRYRRKNGEVLQLHGSS